MQTESLASKIACICLYLPVFARACARSEEYKSFQSYACHLRNPAVQQATVEIRDTEFPLPPPLDFWPLAAREPKDHPWTPSARAPRHAHCMWGTYAY